jgi:hypothetical protein
MSSPAQPTAPAPLVPPASAPTHIDTSSPNNVRVWIRNSIADGRLKLCVNLDMHQIVETRGAPDEKETRSYFVPHCVHRSFISNHSGLSDEHQAEFLKWSLHTNPLSCPMDCTFYQNRRWADVKTRAAFPFTALFRFMKAMLKGYAALAWQTQVTIIGVPALVLILWKAPSWVPQIIALAKALWGK